MEKGYKGEDAEKKKIEQHGLFIETIINEYTDEQQNGFVVDLLSRIADFRQRRSSKLEDDLHAINRASGDLKESLGGMMGFIEPSPMPTSPYNRLQ